MTQTTQLRSGAVSQFFFELRAGLRSQSSVIFALIFRELKTRSGPDSHGLLSLAGIVLEPAIGVAVLSTFWYLIKRQEIEGVHVALFLTVSMTGFSIMRRSIATIPKSVRSSRAFYTFPNVKPFDAIVARFIIELTLTVVGGMILLFLLWWFLDITISFRGILPGTGIFMLVVVAALGTSLVLGVYGTIYPRLLTTISVFSRGLLFVSAVIHPASELPPEATEVLAVNPLAHALELMRWYLIGIPHFPHASVRYIGGFAMVMLALGFLSYYVNRFRLIER